MDRKECHRLTYPLSIISGYATEPRDVLLCNPLVTPGPYLSAFEVQPTTWQSSIQIHITLLYLLN